VNKLEETAIGVERPIKTATAEVETNYMTRVLVALDTTPPAAIPAFRLPERNFRISRRINRCRHIDGKAFLEFQQGEALIIMAQ
jgi:hypothetical protein